MAKSLISAMSLGEILDNSFTVYRERFGLLMGISIVFMGIPALMNVYVELSGGAVVQSGLFLIALLLSSLAWLPGSAAIVWVISEAALGHGPQLGEAVSRGISHAFKLFLAGIVAYLIVVVGMILLIVPGIIWACGYSVIVQVVVLEELNSGTDALGRSWRLTKGYKGKAFMLVLTFSLLFSVPFIAAGIVAAMVPSLMVPIRVASQILSFVVTPLFACVLTLFYYDLRVRQEGFDLEHLSRELGLSTARSA